MTGRAGAPARPRTPLSREQVLRAGIEFVDENGLDALSMRKLGRVLGVEAMSLYNHVRDKDDLLEGMVDLVWDGIVPPSSRGDWRAAVRKTAVSANKALLKHPWACTATISSGRIHPARMRYIEGVLGRLRKAGFTAGLAFHAYHAIDSHIIGYTMWDAGHVIPLDKTPQLAPDFLEDHPHLAEHSTLHQTGSGRGLDEFTFTLDLILDGLEREREETEG